MWLFRRGLASCAAALPSKFERIRRPSRRPPSKSRGVLWHRYIQRRRAKPGCRFSQISKTQNESKKSDNVPEYLRDFGIEKIVRDLRVHEILEGTNEIMQVIIARHTLN